MRICFFVERGVTGQDFTCEMECCFLEIFQYRSVFVEAKYSLLVLWMNFAVEAEAPLVVMVLVELLAIVFPTWVILAFMY